MLNQKVLSPEEKIINLKNELAEAVDLFAQWESASDTIGELNRFVQGFMMSDLFEETDRDRLNDLLFAHGRICEFIVKVHEISTELRTYTKVTELKAAA